MSTHNSTTDSTAARLVRATGDPQYAGFVVEREWPKIHATSADTLTVALNGVTRYSAVQADGQEYTGPFVNSQVQSVADDEDAVTIRQRTTKVQSIAADSTLFALDAEKRRVQEVVHPFSDTGRYDPDSDAQVDDLEIFRIRYIDPLSYNYVDSITDTTYEANLREDTNWGYVRKDISTDTGDKTLTLEVRFRKLVRDHDVDTFVGDINADASETVFRRYDDGDDDAIAISGDTGVGKTVRSQVSRSADGTFVKEKGVRTAKTHGTDSYVARVAPSFHETFKETRNAASQPADQTKAIGQIKHLRSTKLPDGGWNTETTITYSDSLTEYAPGGTAGYSDSVRVIENDSAPVYTGRGGTGVTVSVSPQINADGRISLRESTRTATALGPKYGKGGTLGFTDSEAVRINQTLSDTAGNTGDTGVTYSISPSLSQDGTVAYGLRKRTANALGPKYGKGGTVGYTDSEAVYLNQKLNDTAGSIGDTGVTYTSDISLAQDGTVNRVQRKRTVNQLGPDTVTVGTVGYSDDITVTRGLKGGFPSVGAGTAGVTTGASVRFSSDGTVSIVRRDRTSNAQQDTYVAYDGEFGSTKVELYENAATIPDAASDTKKEVSITSARITVDGKRDYVKRTVDATNDLPSDTNFVMHGGKYWLKTFADSYVTSTAPYYETYRWALSYHNSRAVALAAIKGGMVSSSVRRLAPKVYEARRVTDTADVTAASLGWNAG